jgi:hypothetical protein
MFEQQQQRLNHTWVKAQLRRHAYNCSAVREQARADGLLLFGHVEQVLIRNTKFFLYFKFG